MPINNSIAECGVRACTYYTGGVVGPTTPSNCAITESANGGIEIRTITTCYGPTDDMMGKPTDAYRECESCTWGFKKQIAGSYMANCGLLSYEECLPASMSTTQCFDEGPVETFTNQNGCARGQRRYLFTDTHGLLGPIEYCEKCQTGYKQVLHNVEINGCTNGPFEGAYCEDTRECIRDSDCAGWVRGGAPVDPVNKPGLLKVITCNEANKCTHHYRCDEDPGYYNGPGSSLLGPTGCIKCPLYQGKYGDGHIRRKAGDTSITGCFIELGTTINANEGTFELDSHCYY